MTKKLIVLLLALVAISVPASAANLNATLINTSGDKVVVAVGSSDANYWLDKGYVLLGSKPVQSCSCSNVGANGQSWSSRQFFDSGSTNGGLAVRAITTAAPTITAAYFPAGATTLIWTPAINTTISLTATSASALVPQIGQSAVVYIQNASTTAASSITFAAADSNVDLQKANYTGSDLIIDGLDWEKVTFIRTTAKKVTVFVESMTEGD